MSTYKKEITVTQNDYGYNLPLEATNKESGDPLDLTGNTSVKLYVAKQEATEAKIAGGTCIVDDAENGLCHYVVQDGDFDEAPITYLAEIEVTYATKVVTARGLLIKVAQELPET